MVSNLNYLVKKMVIRGASYMIGEDQGVSRGGRHTGVERAGSAGDRPAGRPEGGTTGVPAGSARALIFSINSTW